MRELLTTDPKIAYAVASGTAGTGFGTFLELIPNDIGKLATLVGIVLSIVLIATHARIYKKTGLELQVLRAEAEEREARRATQRDRSTD